MIRERWPNNIPPTFEEEKKIDPVSPVLEEASEAGYIRIKFSRPIYLNEGERKLSDQDAVLDNK